MNSKGLIENKIKESYRKFKMNTCINKMHDSLKRNTQVSKISGV